MARKVVAIECGEGEVSGAVLRNVFWNCHGKQLKVGPMKLNNGIAGSEWMLPTRSDREAQRLVSGPKRVKVTPGKDQVIDAFH
jgi:hypothetical protein